VLQQTRALRLQPGGAAPPLAAPGEALLERPDVVALYIRLLCQYEPGQVLHFLQGHQNYDVRACIRWGRRAGAACSSSSRLRAGLGLGSRPIGPGKPLAPGRLLGWGKLRGSRVDPARASETAPPGTGTARSTACRTPRRTSTSGWATWRRR
jgi:hypothetical protein